MEMMTRGIYSEFMAVTSVEERASARVALHQNIVVSPLLPNPLRVYECQPCFVSQTRKCIVFEYFEALFHSQRLDSLLFM